MPGETRIDSEALIESSQGLYLIITIYIELDIVPGSIRKSRFMQPWPQLILIARHPSSCEPRYECEFVLMQSRNSP